MISCPLLCLCRRTARRRTMAGTAQFMQMTAINTVREGGSYFPSALLSSTPEHPDRPPSNPRLPTPLQPRTGLKRFRAGTRRRPPISFGFPPDLLDALPAREWSKAGAFPRATVREGFSETDALPTRRKGSLKNLRKQNQRQVTFSFRRGRVW